jgi:hypothetical protein
MADGKTRKKGKSVLEKRRAKQARREQRTIESARRDRAGSNAG